MLKKVLTTALFGASALGVAAANAAAPGVYVTGQLGYAQTHMKHKTDLDAISKNLPAGESFIVKDSNDKNLANNGLAGRLAIGYQFNQNFAVELGYLRLGSKKIDLKSAKMGNPAIDLKDSSMTFAQNALDLAAKGIVPISNNFNVYGKLGVAYLTSNVSIDGKDSKDQKVSYNINDAAGLKKRQWAPEVAVGVSYDITPNVAIDTSWTHIHTIGKNRAGNVNFASVGLSYNFG